MTTELEIDVANEQAAVCFSVTFKRPVTVGHVREANEKFNNKNFFHSIPGSNSLILPQRTVHFFSF